MAAEMRHSLYNCLQSWYSALVDRLPAAEVQMAVVLRIRRHFFALPELVASVEELGHGDSAESLKIMISGKRLKDISDLPLDLAV